MINSCIKPQTKIFHVKNYESNYSFIASLDRNCMTEVKKNKDKEDGQNLDEGELKENENLLDGKKLYDLYRHSTKLIK